MKKRSLLAVGVLAVTVLSTGAADAAAKKKPKTPTCPSFVDAAADDRNAQTNANEDPALDVVKVRESVKGSTFTAAITVTRLADPTNADGGEYSAGFVAGGKLIELFGTRSRSKPVTDVAFALKGITVDGKYVSQSESKVTYVEDAAKNTITLSASLADLSSAAGTQLKAATVGSLSAAVRGVYGVLLFDYDTAAAPTAVKFKLADCK